MKNVILLRHAKSEPLLSEMSDFKRKLNEKGRNDVPRIANVFRELHIVPDVIICSTAARTRETLDLFYRFLKLDVPVVYKDELYHASASGILDLIHQYSHLRNIMVVGHNFGISDVADHLCNGGANVMNTCGLYVIRFKKEIDYNKGEILHYLSPKTI